MIVGDRGQAYLSGLEDRGALDVKWGPGLDQQCRAAFTLADQPSPAGMTELTINCL